MDPQHTDKFYQYLVGKILNLIVRWSFQIQSRLLVFCTDDLEYVADLGHVLFDF